MRLYTFEVSGRQRIGAEWNGQLVDLVVGCEAMHRMRSPKPGTLLTLPNSMIELLGLGPTGLQTVRETLAFMSKRPAIPVGVQVTYSLDSVKLLAPIPRPGKIICSIPGKPGSNVEKSDPLIWLKVSTAVISPKEPIILPPSVNDSYCELQWAAVIGQRMRHTPENAAMQHVAGYTILTDVSAAREPDSGGQTAIARNFDTFCPMGPCMVTTDEFASQADPRASMLINDVNLRQGSTTAASLAMPRILSFLSGVMSLEPGDLVGIRVLEQSAMPLKMGDTVRHEIEGIGALENPVVRPQPL